MFVQTNNPFGGSTLENKKGSFIILIGVCLFGFIMIYKLIVWQNQINNVTDKKQILLFN